MDKPQSYIISVIKVFSAEPEKMMSFSRSSRMLGIICMNNSLPGFDLTFNFH